MKKYQKAQMIAKNLPTGSYAAGCPEHTHYQGGGGVYVPGGSSQPCTACELAQ